MMVRTAHMVNGDEFEVSSYDLVGCFKRGYVYGANMYGQYVLNVSHILYFGPRSEALWLKENAWAKGESE